MIAFAADSSGKNAAGPNKALGSYKFESGNPDTGLLGNLAGGGANNGLLFSPSGGGNNEDSNNDHHSSFDRESVLEPHSLLMHQIPGGGGRNGIVDMNSVNSFLQANQGANIYVEGRQGGAGLSGVVGDSNGYPGMVLPSHQNHFNPYMQMQSNPQARDLNSLNVNMFAQAAAAGYFTPNGRPAPGMMYQNQGQQEQYRPLQAHGLGGSGHSIADMFPAAPSSKSNLQDIMNPPNASMQPQDAVIGDAPAVRQAEVAKKRKKSTKKEVKPRRKKPKDSPRRPLSAYNLFFRYERKRIIAEIPVEEKKKKEKDTRAEITWPGKKKTPHGKIGFESVSNLKFRLWAVYLGCRQEKALHLLSFCFAISLHGWPPLGMKMIHQIVRVPLLTSVHYRIFHSTTCTSACQNNWKAMERNIPRTTSPLQGTRTCRFAKVCR